MRLVAPRCASLAGACDLLVATVSSSHPLSMVRDIPWYLSKQGKGKLNLEHVP